MHTAILNYMSPITLEQMKGIKLMNRVDTKFIMPYDKLAKFLEWASASYSVQEIDGKRVTDYHTVYFDTPDREMYTMHHNGKKVREKIRVRSYVDSSLSFLEVKNKNNKGRTDKKRVVIDSIDEIYTNENCSMFLDKHAWYMPNEIQKTLENKFQRITLVNKDKTERLTIDINLTFHHMLTDRTYSMENLVIIELKRDGLTHSPILESLNQMRIQNVGISKYCLGEYLTDDGIKTNRLKPRVRNIMKIINQ